MSDKEHVELADCLQSVKSKVVLSGYPSDLYSKLFRDWNRTETDIANHSAGGKEKSRKTECIWTNF